MQIKYHGQHITITGDEDILQRAGIELNPSPLRKGELPTTYKAISTNVHTGRKRKMMQFCT